MSGGSSVTGGMANNSLSSAWVCAIVAFGFQYCAVRVKDKIKWPLERRDVETRPRSRRYHFVSYLNAEAVPANDSDTPAGSLFG